MTLVSPLRRCPLVFIPGPIADETTASQFDSYFRSTVWGLINCAEHAESPILGRIGASHSNPPGAFPVVASSRVRSPSFLCRSAAQGPRAHPKAQKKPGLDTPTRPIPAVPQRRIWRSCNGTTLATLRGDGLTKGGVGPEGFGVFPLFSSPSGGHCSFPSP